MYIIGIDPDSKNHGVAVYANGVLIVCDTETTISIVTLIIPRIKALGESIHFSIEDVNSQNFIYAKNSNANKSVERNIGMRIAKCQQAQIELIRWIEHYGISLKAGTGLKIRHNLKRLQVGKGAAVRTEGLPHTLGF